MKLEFNGVLPPMITPFTAAGEVDYDGFSFNMDRWNEAGLCGYLCLGSNSETAYLDHEEKVNLLKLTVKKARPGSIILAGTGMESERETIKFTNEAADLGAHAALILTPSYYTSNMDAAAMINFFTNVANNVKIPVMIYNVPKFTHVNIQDGALKTLCKHENIIGMKDSTGDINQLVRFQALTAGEDFQILTGTAGAWFPALTLGVKAGIFALANSNPKELVELKKLFDNKEYESARTLFRKLYVMNTAVTATYGVAGLKYACELLGYKGGFVRSPLMELSEDKKAEIAKIFGE